MTQTIGNILIFFFRFDRNIIFISLGTEVFSDWAISSFFFPLSDVLIVKFMMERSIGNESVFVGKCKDKLIVEISSWKT